MPPIPSLEPEERAKPAVIERAETRIYRAVPCLRCAETLYYPSVRKTRNGIICCGRCGARTAIPTWTSQMLKVGWILFLAVAAVLIAFAAMHQG